MGLRDRLIFRTRRPALRPPGRARARGLGAGPSATSSSSTASPSRRSSSRRYGADPAFRPERPEPDGEPYALFVGALQPRKDAPTAIEALALLGRRAAARPRRPRQGRPRRGRGDGERGSAGASSSAATSSRTSSPALYRGARLPRLPVAATRASGCRCSRRWPRARRSSRPPPARCRRSPATRRSSSSRATRSRSRAGSSARSPTASGSRAAGPRAGAPVHLGRDRPPHARGLPGAARVRVAAVVIWTPGDPDPGPCLDSLAPQVDELVLVATPAARRRRARRR